MSELLTGIEIMAVEDIGLEIVEVPEWGGYIRILRLQPTQDTLDLLQGLEDDLGDVAACMRARNVSRVPWAEERDGV